MTLAPPHAAASEQLAIAVEAAGMQTWLWDMDTGSVSWSEGVAALLGLDREGGEVTYEAYLSALPAEERPVVVEAIDRALRGETETYAVEHRVLLAGGGVRWLAARGKVFRDASGRAVRMAGVVWDVTARREAEARMAQLRRLSAVVTAINKQVLHVTSDRELFEAACRIAVELGQFLFAWVGLVSADGAHVEPAARWGFEDGYLDGVRIDVADTPRGRGPTGTAVREGHRWVCADMASDPAFEPWREKALARGYRSGAAFPLRRGGRVIGALSVYGDRAGLFDDEALALLEGLADDIGFALDLLDREERRRAAEETMRLSEARHRMLVEKAADAIVMIDQNRRFLDANEAACRIMGRTREQLLELRVEDVLDAANLAVDPLRFKHIPPGGVVITDRRVVRDDGSSVDVEVSTKAFEDGRFQSVLRDVTERKNVQAQLLLADRMASLGRLASGVAHEVNNPLAYVMLNFDVLAQGLAEIGDRAPKAAREKMEQALAAARDGAERVRRIVRMLSAFGRGDEERIGAVEVNGVIESSVEIASMQLRHRARLVKQLDATAPASANAFRLGQVIVNLLVNAADALRDDDPANEIRVRSFTRDDGWVVMEVTDNGVGIPREMQSRIFDPFFTSKPIGQGTGLGLSVCHAIVRSFGGEIACDSAVGKGTTFRVSLPPARATPVPSAPPPSSDVRPPMRGRVLVVDDDARLASAIASALDAHDVVVVTSGKEAIARARSEPFDCIVCDLIMPDASGVDVYEALEKDGRGAHGRIVFLTGGAVTEASRALLARVPNPVLEKPLDAGFLRRAVARAVERARGTDGA